jgi:hypothetical protein
MGALAPTNTSSPQHGRHTERTQDGCQAIGLDGHRDFLRAQQGEAGMKGQQGRRPYTPPSEGLKTCTRRTEIPP